MRRCRLCQLPWMPLLILLPAAAVVFFWGVGWGLPSRRVDPFLFGDHRVWSGAQLLQLAGPTEDPQRGADVATHRIAVRGRPVATVNPMRRHVRTALRVFGGPG